MTKRDDPEAFLLEVVTQAKERLGQTSAQVIGACAGALVALVVPAPGGFLLRSLIGSAIGSIVGKRVSGKDSAWFKKRLERAMDRFEEINRLHREKKCTEAERDGYVDDLVERFFDRNDSLLE